ncbi:unnamed protein product [Tuber melanosporum]|uniref:(Perigord truffle) hypothetical protein n=1 Tax=Tuber melanosporum (strain Mel28) TaxID=656061 RepID=D5GPL4_TUBMM|nr:uncharacterized protein GSTUM_00011903001 [Tuber melanosporum]CAZ86457.1 unnamed protein product [Tuber melanosporum]
MKVSNNPSPDENFETPLWPPPPEPRIRHQDIQPAEADPVGEWLLQTDEPVEAVLAKIDLIALPCFAMAIQGLGRLTRGSGRLRRTSVPW